MYFEDGTTYSYFSEKYRPVTLNIGWLEHGHSFETETPSEDVLNSLWEFCKIAVSATRGSHRCDICGKSEVYWVTDWKTEKLSLGTAEIRVFGAGGLIYAAPNLVFHYIQRHHYKPPQPFLDAMLNRPRPPDSQYFDRLRQLNLNWSEPPEFEAPHTKWVPPPVPN